MMAYYGYRWRPYVPVAKRRSDARQSMAKLRKKGLTIQPVTIEGRTIVKTFWGKAWCDQMESLGDFDNRLPRGRTYVRNGSVCHLEISKGRIAAIVSGSSLYKINIKIKTLPKAKWERVKRRCAGQIGSLIELLQGKLSTHVMETVTDPDDGLFPTSSEIELGCNCPDWAYLCKHLAAVLYGVGARLDESPELLFLLRGVKHDQLIDTRVDQAVAGATGRGGRRPTVASNDLADVFGIEIDPTAESDDGKVSKPKRTRRKTVSERKPKTKSRPKVRTKKVVRTTIGKTSESKTGGESTTKKKAASKVRKKVVAKKTPRKKRAKKKATKKVITKKTITKKVRAKQTTKKKAVKKHSNGTGAVKKRTGKQSAKKTARAKTTSRAGKKKISPKAKAARRSARKGASSTT